MQDHSQLDELRARIAALEAELQEEKRARAESDSLADGRHRWIKTLDGRLKSRDVQLESANARIFELYREAQKLATLREAFRILTEGVALRIHESEPAGAS